MIVKSDRTELTGISLSILSYLEEDIPDAIGTRVDSEDNWSI